MTEPVDPLQPGRELERKNIIWGLALFGVFVALFGATIGVAFVYLALD